MLFFRNSGMGMVSIASRLGAACAPFVVQMTRINPVMPFAFMGGLTMFGALLCSILPETRGRSTAEVFEDTAEKQQGRFRFHKRNGKKNAFLNGILIHQLCRLTGDLPSLLDVSRVLHW